MRVRPRYPITANGSGGEPFGNLTITVTPTGQVSVRLPKPLEHLANAKRGRYVLSGRAVFSHRGQEWAARITGGKSVSYTITREPGRAGRYLTASWGTPAPPSVPAAAGSRRHDGYAAGPVVGVDLNDGHLGCAASTLTATPSASRHVSTSIYRVHRHGGTLGPSRDHPADPLRPPVWQYGDRCGGSRLRRRASHRTRNDGSSPPRETVPPHRGWDPDRGVSSPTGSPSGHGQYRSVGGQPRLQQCLGDAHWRKPYENVTRHQAAATVIGRRAQGFRARRRKGVTHPRPEDRGVRATDQAGPDSPQASNTGNRHRPGMRGTESRQPDRARTRQPRRATVTPAPANNGLNRRDGNVASCQT